MKKLLTAVILVAAACNDPGAPKQAGTPVLPPPATRGLGADTTGPDSTPMGTRGVTVSPSSSIVVTGDTTAFSAIVRDARGNVISGARVKWNVGDPTVAQIEQNLGPVIILRALRPGTTPVSASSRGSTGTAQLVVADSVSPPPPDSTPVDSVPPPHDSTTTQLGATLRRDHARAPGGH